MSIESRSCQYGKVFDHWQIGELLGSGSGGQTKEKTAVFKLSRIDSSRGKSALKVINLIEEKGHINALSAHRRNEYEQAKGECKKSAEQEVWLMNELQGNTNIVGYLDHTFVDWQDSTGFGYDMLIRMELLEDLRSKLRDEHHYSEKEILKIGRDVCTALVLCHNKGIIHRDIKPENIFINADGNYKLGDFGISRILSAAPSAMASSGVGTPEYAAPEQFMRRYDKRVDIYSLGLVLYELSNGNKLPFASTSYVRPIDVEKRNMGIPLPKLEEISTGFWKVIQKACAFNPEDRYQTAEEFLTAINKLSGISTPLSQRKSYDDHGKRRDIPETKGNATQKATADRSKQKSNYDTIPARTQKNHNSDTSVEVKKKTAKRVVLGIILVLLVVVAVFWGMGIFAEMEAISGIIDEAQSYADGYQYSEAILTIQDGMEEYPNSNDLQEKLDEFTDLQTEFEITAIITASEELASVADYESAIAQIENGLDVYPDSIELQDKLTEYSDLLAAQIKAQTLTEAQVFAESGDYKAAMVVIETALQKNGADTDYNEAYLLYEKKYALASANEYANNGDLPNALLVLSSAIENNSTDEDLLALYNQYSSSYVSKIQAESSTAYQSGGYEAAVSVINDALNVLSDNDVLKKEKEKYEALKPSWLSSLEVFSYGHNGPYNVDIDAYVTDRYKNRYSSSFSIEDQDTITWLLNGKYEKLTGIISCPEEYLYAWERSNVIVQIFCDEEKVFTSAEAGPEEKPQTFSIDLTGVEKLQIKWYCLESWNIWSDWCMYGTIFDGTLYPAFTG